LVRWLGLATLACRILGCYIPLQNRSASDGPEVLGEGRETTESSRWRKHKYHGAPDGSRRGGGGQSLIQVLCYVPHGAGGLEG
jgi:hypothetical protein